MEHRPRYAARRHLPDRPRLPADVQPARPGHHRQPRRLRPAVPGLGVRRRHQLNSTHRDRPGQHRDQDPFPAGQRTLHQDPKPGQRGQLVVDTRAERARPRRAGRHAAAALRQRRPAQDGHIARRHPTAHRVQLRPLRRDLRRAVGRHHQHLPAAGRRGGDLHDPPGVNRSTRLRLSRSAPEVNSMTAPPFSHPWFGRSRPAALTALVAAAALVTAFTVPAAAASAASNGGETVAPAHGLPYEDATLPVTERVADLLARMTLAEKVGQMTQTERYQVFDDATPITTWHLGGILSGGGSTPSQNTPTAWADMVDRFQQAALATRLRIPLLYGIDSVHGDGNMYGATVFPHNIGLGATRDPALVREVEHVTASETRASGPQWTFAPCICAPQDDRWGRTYEGFGEDPKLVIEMESAIDGFQGPPGHLADRDRVLATAKHFAGDGDTTYGTASGDYKIDHGIAITNRQDFS